MITGARTARANVYGLLSDNREKLVKAIDGLAAEAMSAPAVDDWSVKDILTHITSWEEMVVLDMGRIVRGHTPARYHGETDEWNRLLMSVRREFSVDQVLSELTETRDALLKALDGIAEDKFELGDVPGACQISALHDWDHARQIGAWRERAGV